jgi:hypothetical protein
MASPSLGHSLDTPRLTHGTAGSPCPSQGCGATVASIGRTLSYELVQTVPPLDEATLQAGLQQLVET